eukprot:COSAG02_NODE_4938_length_4811_cov_23.006791_4_plen_150_part_00
MTSDSTTLPALLFGPMTNFLSKPPYVNRLMASWRCVRCSLSNITQADEFGTGVSVQDNLTERSGFLLAEYGKVCRYAPAEDFGVHEAIGRTQRHERSPDVRRVEQLARQSALCFQLRMECPHLHERDQVAVPRRCIMHLQVVCHVAAAT